MTRRPTQRRTSYGRFSACLAAAINASAAPSRAQRYEAGHGSELTARAVRRWLGQLDVGTLSIEPTSPWQYGYAESFYSRLRDEFLAVEVFESLAAARRLTTACRADYNAQRAGRTLMVLVVSPGSHQARAASLWDRAPHRGERRGTEPRR